MPQSRMHALTCTCHLCLESYFLKRFYNLPYLAYHQCTETLRDITKHIILLQLGLITCNIAGCLDILTLQTGPYQMYMQMLTMQIVAPGTQWFFYLYIGTFLIASLSLIKINMRIKSWRLVCLLSLKWKKKAENRGYFRTKALRSFFRNHDEYSCLKTSTDIYKGSLESKC